MELDDFKSDWKQSGNVIKSQQELEMMTKINRHPKLNRIRIKLVIEAILIGILLVFYNNLFDATDKPMWANVILVISIVTHLMTGIYGYFIIKFPLSGKNIKVSIVDFSKKLQKLSKLSIGSALFFGIALLLFFTSTIQLTTIKYLLLGGMIITLVGMTAVLAKNWRIKVKNFAAVVNEFA